MASRDPSVSPADTPADEFPDSTPRPWYFDGWDIFTSSSSAGPRGDGHRMVIPLRAINDTWHPSQRVSDDDARLIVAAVNERAALLAVGERDRRQIARLTERVELLEVLGEQAVGTISFLHGCLTEPHEDGKPGGFTYAHPEQTERRLAELRQFLPERTVCVHSKFVPDCRGCIDGEHAREVMGRARAVLAGEEDARP